MVPSTNGLGVENHRKTEKPTNCGTKTADVLANVLAGKLQCESSKYFGAFATTMISQRFLVLLHLLPFGSNLKGEF